VSPVRYELGFYIPEDDILHAYNLIKNLRHSHSRFLTGHDSSVGDNMVQ
jgi:hypothetical protein